LLKQTEIQIEHLTMFENQIHRSLNQIENQIENLMQFEIQIHR